MLPLSVRVQVCLLLVSKLTLSPVKRLGVDASNSVVRMKTKTGQVDTLDGKLE
jgi:hypothetical protein